MKRIVFLLFSLCIFLPYVSAKEKSMIIRGHIADAVTRTPLDGSITVMKGDSTKLFERQVKGGYNAVCEVTGNAGDTFIFKFDADGYEPASMNFTIPEKGRNIQKDLKPVLLFKKRIRELGEVTVKASKVKMVMKGDTIVYNADAFELANGSMLDALIERLPGVELNDGVISVTGQRVNSLLLNGENFFQGDPTVALQNLPAFTVKNVKVYDKEAEDAYITGKNSKEDKSLVMDVILKRDYSVGLLGNIEGGYGMPHNRWMGRGFLLAFADNIRVTAFANANNINNSTTAGTGGQWSQEDRMQGENRLVKEGVDYMFHNRKKPLMINGNVILTHDRNNTLRENSIRNYLPSADNWERNRYNVHNRDFRIITSHTVTLMYPSSYTALYPKFEYADNKSRTLTRDAVFTRELQEKYRLGALDSVFSGIESPLLLQALSYRYADSRTAATRWIDGSVAGSTSFKASESGGSFLLNYSGGYRYDHYDMLSEYDIVYPHQGSLSKKTDRTQLKKEPKYNVGVGLSYMASNLVNAKSFRMDMKYEVGYDFKSDTEDEAWYNLLEQVSSRRQLLPELDPENTFRQRTSFNKPRANIVVDMWITGMEKAAPTSVATSSFYSKISLDDYVSIEHLNYNAPKSRTGLNRTANFFRPEIRMVYMADNLSARDPENPQWNLARRNIVELSYGYSDRLAPLSYMVDYHRSPDPLTVNISNPNLKRYGSHKIVFDWRLDNMVRQQGMNAHAELRIRPNALVQARFYDPQSGVSTWMPDNISGNWNFYAKYSFNTPLTRDKKLEFSTTTFYYFDNNVDFVSTSATPERSTVRSNRPGETVKLTWSHGGFRISGAFTAQLRTARSDRSNFTNLNLWDLRPSLDMKIPIPGGIQFSTNLDVTRRYGYSDPSFRKAEVLWNAELSKSLIQGKLLFKLRAYDILGRVSPYSTIINAQSFTETFTNTLTRYVMLQVSYRFNHIPKKK